MNFTETLQNITKKSLSDCSNQELYLALLEIVRQKSTDRIQPVTGRKLYYISADYQIRTVPKWTAPYLPSYAALPLLRSDDIH